MDFSFRVPDCYPNRTFTVQLAVATFKAGARKYFGHIYQTSLGNFQAPHGNHKTATGYTSKLLACTLCIEEEGFPAHREVDEEVSGGADLPDSLLPRSRFTGPGETL